MLRRVKTAVLLGRRLRVKSLDLTDVLRVGRPNVLVVDPTIKTSEILLSPCLLEPITRCAATTDPLALPAEHGGTLILQRVEALDATGQQVLLNWLERDGGRTQVVSFAAACLFPRVEQGAFLESLYYRLNTIFVDGAGLPAPAPHRFARASLRK